MILFLTVFPSMHGHRANACSRLTRSKDNLEGDHNIITFSFIFSLFSSDMAYVFNYKVVSSLVTRAIILSVWHLFPDIGRNCRFVVANNTNRMLKFQSLIQSISAQDKKGLVLQSSVVCLKCRRTKQTRRTG